MHPAPPLMIALSLFTKKLRWHRRIGIGVPLQTWDGRQRFIIGFFMRKTASCSWIEALISFHYTHIVDWWPNNSSMIIINGLTPTRPEPLPMPMVTYCRWILQKSWSSKMIMIMIMIIIIIIIITMTMIMIIIIITVMIMIIIRTIMMIIIMIMII